MAVLDPFHHCGHENSAFEAHMHISAGRQLDGMLPHRTAFRNILKSEAARGAVDQQLQLAPFGGNPGMTALIGGDRVEFRPDSGGPAVVVPRLRERNCRPAKAAFGADPADIPLRAAAAGAVVSFIGAINDVVAAMREPSRERGGCPFVNENVGHGCTPKHPGTMHPRHTWYETLLENSLPSGSKRHMRIAVVAPSNPLKRQAAEAVEGIVRDRGDCEVFFHQQCFLSAGHFAGTDEQRLAALREVMADPAVDAVWFAKGGYGSNRIAEAAAREFPEVARSKLYMGYSDTGFLLAGFHKAGLEVAHGPMPQDVLREGGEAAVNRALDWLVRRDSKSLEPNLRQPAMAFNLTVLSTLLGTVLEPDFSGVELLIEEVSEHHYRIDRLMFHVTSSANVRRAARIRLGRASDIPENDPDFGSNEQAIVADWCSRSGIQLGSRADVGHDSANKVVPFGRTPL